MLEPLLELAALEEKASGFPTRKTLLNVAECLVRYAPNLFTASNTPSYSDEEAAAAKALLRKHGLEKLGNLSPRFKKATLALIATEKAKEA